MYKNTHGLETTISLAYAQKKAPARVRGGGLVLTANGYAPYCAPVCYLAAQLDNLAGQASTVTAWCCVVHG